MHPSSMQVPVHMQVHVSFASSQCNVAEDTCTCGVKQWECIGKMHVMLLSIALRYVLTFQVQRRKRGGQSGEEKMHNEVVGGEQNEMMGRDKPTS